MSVESQEQELKGHAKSHSGGKELCSRLLGRDSLDRVKATEGMHGLRMENTAFAVQAVLTVQALCTATTWSVFSLIHVGAGEDTRMG